MPTFLDYNTDEAPFMYWVPGTTEKAERAEKLAQAIAEQAPVEEDEG